MEPDEDLCLCFHVSRRKVTNFLKVHRPKRLSQLSECYGAGTGCGWCRPFLQRLFEQTQENGPRPSDLREAESGDLPSAEDYARSRQIYLDETGKRPPRTA
ncbi:MAG: (2Fe-2S)-binding protein [Pirellulaceae bacterium]|nr:(2Fe-2S)-binding protein [Planctomycetales bacterium]